MKVCSRCKSKVTTKCVSLGYSFYCPDCDEDLYSFEVEEMSEKQQKKERTTIITNRKRNTCLPDWHSN